MGDNLGVSTPSGREQQENHILHQALGEKWKARPTAGAYTISSGNNMKEFNTGISPRTKLGKLSVPAKTAFFFFNELPPLLDNIKQKIMVAFARCQEQMIQSQKQTFSNRKLFFPSFNHLECLTRKTTAFSKIVHYSSFAIDVEKLMPTLQRTYKQLMQRNFF